MIYAFNYISLFDLHHTLDHDRFVAVLELADKLLRP